MKSDLNSSKYSTFVSYVTLMLLFLVFIKNKKIKKIRCCHDSDSQKAILGSVATPSTQELTRNTNSSSTLDIMNLETLRVKVSEICV